MQGIITIFKLDERARAMRVLAGVKWGVSARSARALYRGYLEPVATYGLGAYASFLSRKQKERIQAALNRGARSILGVPMGVPAAVLHSVSNVPSLEDLTITEVTLNIDRALRNPNITLRKLAVNAAVQNPDGPLAIALWQLEEVFPEKSFIRDPYIVGDKIYCYPHLDTVEFETDTLREEIDIERLAERWGADELAYTDASVLDGGRFSRKYSAGGAYVIYGEKSSRYEKHSESFPLEASTSYKAEQLAILKLLQFYNSETNSTVGRDSPRRRILILTDCLSELQHLRLFHRETDIDSRIMHELNALSRRADVMFAHVKGHVGLRGNEQADKMAAIGREKELIGRADKKWRYSAKEAKLHLKGLVKQLKEDRLETAAQRHDLAKWYRKAATKSAFNPVKSDKPRWITSAIARLMVGYVPGGSVRHGAQMEKCPHCVDGSATSSHVIFECPVLQSPRQSLINRWKNDKKDSRDINPFEYTDEMVQFVEDSFSRSDPIATEKNGEEDEDRDVGVDIDADDILCYPECEYRILFRTHIDDRSRSDSKEEPEVEEVTPPSYEDYPDEDPTMSPDEEL